MNDQNLVSLATRPERERKEIARKGALASAETKRQRKTLKEELIALLSMNGNQERMSLAVLEKALGGNLKAFETIRDTIGEKAPEKVESTELQTSSYEDFIKATKGDEY